MNNRIKELAEQAWDVTAVSPNFGHPVSFAEKFAELIVQDCINKIETYHIPVGNSPSGELACEWTYSALKELVGDIKEHFGVEE